MDWGGCLVDVVVVEEEEEEEEEEVFEFEEEFSCRPNKFFVEVKIGGGGGISIAVMPWVGSCVVHLVLLLV